MNICLAGPCAPVDLVSVMDIGSRERATTFKGLRGIPVSDLAKVLVELGHEVTVVTTSDQILKDMFFTGPNFYMRVIPQRSSAKILGFTLYFREILRIRKSMKEISSRVDVINVHWTYEFALATFGLKSRVVITVHDSPWQVLKTAENPFWLFRYVMALLVRIFCSRKTFVFVSEDLKSKWKDEFRWKKDSHVVPNMQPFHSERNIPVPREAAMRLMVASDSSRRKNVDIVLRTIPLLEQVLNERVEIHFVGFGLGLHDNLARTSPKNSKLVSLVWHGYLERREFKQLLRTATCLIQPSLVESFGLTLLEAFALRVPVICGWNPGATAEIVGDAALVIDMRFETNLCESIIKILKNESLRIELIEKGQNRLDKLFSPTIVANSYLEIFESQ